MATRNNFSYQESEGTAPSLPASLKLLRANLPVEKKRIPVGLFDIDTYPPDELTHRLVFNALTADFTRHVITANAQFYVMAERSRRFRKCLERAEYVCADGFSILLACKLLTRTTVVRCPGVDLVRDLCREGAGHGLRVYFLGGAPGSAESTADILAADYPGLEVVGIDCPPMHFEKHPDTLHPVLSRLAHARPQVVFVGLGAPKQEYFIDQHVRPMDIPVAVGVGGTFEIISGRVPRAPEWVRNVGMEWFYRLVKEPKRLWRRYLIGNLEFLFIVSLRFFLGSDAEHEPF